MCPSTAVGVLACVSTRVVEPLFLPDFALPRGVAWGYLPGGYLPHWPPSTMKLAGCPLEAFQFRLRPTTVLFSTLFQQIIMVNLEEWGNLVFSAQFDLDFDLE